MTPEHKLKRIAEIYGTNDDGAPTTNHARYNLLGALYDMERTGMADEVCLRTIRRVIDQLASIESVLENRTKA